MLLNGKLKRAALLTAVDICLKNVKHSPKRCARNLIELGTSAYPNKLSTAARNELYQILITSIENGDLSAARASFTSVFL